jgi:hypothetical protein
MKKFKTFTSEDAPVNAVSSGNIDGVGYGSKGEPGVKPRLKNKKSTDYMVALLKRMKNV